MRRQDRMRQHKNYLKHSQKLIIRSRVHTQRRLTATLSVTNQRAEIKCDSLASTRLDCCMRSPNTNVHKVQSTAHHPNTHVVHIDVVLLFCLSFTRSVRFLQADQLITRLQRVEHTVTCVNVMESDAVFSVGSDLPHLLIDVRQYAASVPGLYDEPLEES